MNKIKSKIKIAAAGAMEFFSKIAADKFLARALLTLSLFYFAVIFFNIDNLFLLGAVVLALFGALFFYEQLWLFIALTLPWLAFGHVFFIPVAAGWVYEASVPEAALLLVFSSWLLGSFWRGCALKREIKINTVAGLLLAYAFLSVISVWLIIDFRLYIFGLKAAVISFIAYILALNLFNRPDKIKWFLRSLILTSFILSIQLLARYYELGWSVKFLTERNLILIPVGPLALSVAALAMSLPLILTFAIESRKWDKYFGHAAFFFGLAAVILSLGKGAIFSLFLGVLYLFIKLKSKRTQFIIGAVIAAALIYIFFEAFLSGIFTRVSRVLIDSSSRFRIMEYEAGWKIIKENFWFGVGAGQQLIQYDKFLLPGYRQLANNFWLQAAMDLGITGFILMAAIVAAITKLCRRLSSRRRGSILTHGFIASMITVFFNGLVEVTLFVVAYALIFWLMAGVFSNLEKYEENINYNN